MPRRRPFRFAGVISRSRGQVAVMFSSKRLEIAERLCERVAVGPSDEVALDDHGAPLAVVVGRGGEEAPLGFIVHGGDYCEADPVWERAGRDPLIDLRVVADV